MPPRLYFQRWIKLLPTHQWIALALFLGLSSFYVAFSSGSSVGQGYTGEEARSAERILTRLDALRKGVPAPPMLWSRHGPLPILFDVPFVAVGKFVVSPDFTMCLEPALVTAAIAALIFLWLSKLTSPGMSLLIALIGALGTMLWPYAYIGLEPKQSFFVLLAGYLGLACGPVRGWPRVLAFAGVCGIAVSLKSTGVVLFPGIAWLIYVQFGEDRRPRRSEVAAVVVIMGVIWAANAYGRNLFWAPLGGGWSRLRPLLADSPLLFFANVLGIFGSPTKGLFLYAPVLLLSLYAIPRAFRTQRGTAVFVVLVLSGVVFQMAMLRAFADEVWGSRYAHTMIAPLLVLIGVARPAGFTWRRETPLVALGALGVVISFLGALYYYGVLHAATMQAGQNTLEALAGDPVWHAVRFHARLFDAWLNRGPGPVWWTPAHIWMYEPPAGTPPWKAIDLRGYCEPQSVLLNAIHKGSMLPHTGFYAISLAAGVLLLGLAVWGAFRESRAKSRRTVEAIAASATSLEAAASVRCEPDLDRT